MMDDTASCVCRGCMVRQEEMSLGDSIEGVLASPEGVSRRDSEQEDVWSQQDGSLLPMLFSCSASSIVDYREFVEKLQPKLPEGTRFFGLQIRLLNSRSNSRRLYDYRVLLCPIGRHSSQSRDSQKWRELANTTVVLDENNKGVCMVFPGSGRLSVEQTSADGLRYLEIAERIARWDDSQTVHFREIPFHGRLFGSC